MSIATLMEGVDYWKFMGAALALNVTPGQDSVFIVTQSVSKGWKSGVLASLGISTGSLAHMCIAAFGASAFLSRNPSLIRAIQYLGAAYLFYLGVTELIAGARKSPGDAGKKAADTTNVYWNGLLVNLLNPKVSLFFLAFLTPFISMQSRGKPWPYLLLGSSFILSGTIYCCMLSVFSRSLAGRLVFKNTTRISHYVCGILFCILSLSVIALK